jgi:hypothetical protein
MVNDPSQAQYLLVSLGLRTLLGLLLLYIYRRKRQPYVLYWAIAWLLLSLGSLAHFFSVTQSRAPALLPHLDSLLLAFATLLFLDSARVYAGGGVNPGVTVYLAPFFLAWLVLRAAMGGPLQGLPLEWGSAAALAVTGVMVQRDTRRREVMGGTLLASSFFLWAQPGCGALRRRETQPGTPHAQHGWPQPHFQHRPAGRHGAGDGRADLGALGGKRTDAGRGRGPAAGW